MCGIAGYFAPDHSLSSEVIQRMTRCMSHRGPDAEHFFSDATVAFGHRRLSIIDLSTSADQPMISHDGRWVMMFNGEVFNFRELASQLNIPLRTHSDTEVMLETFAANGIGAVDLFNGMFTIALYDRQQRELFLIRDRMGVKPLFYYNKNNRWFFSSEIKALLTVDEVKKKLTLNLDAINLFLQLGYIPEPHTIWNEVKKFPAGSYAKITREQTSFHTYWKPEEKILPAVLSDFQSAKKQFADLLQSAVSYRMISDVPLGIFLSGGIDSSLVAAMAQQQDSSRVKTFTIGFKEKKFNEAEQAKKIAAHLGTDHHEFIVSAQDGLDLCEQSMDMYDEPFADSSAIPTMLVSKMARSEVKMVLSGDGGDELFMGYGMYRWAKRLNNPLTKTFRKPLGAALALMNNRYRRAATLFQYDDEENLPQHIFSQEQYFFTKKESRLLLKEKFSSTSQEFPDSQARKLSVAEKQSLYDLRYYLKDDLLVKVDRATMKYSLECRTPFLDYRLVEFALNLDERFKMRNGRLKILPKEVLKELIPAELFERPKRGFGIPLAHWLQNELRYLVEDYLSPAIIKKHSLVDVEAVEDLKAKFFNGRVYLYNRVWNLIVLHRWLEKNL